MASMLHDTLMEKNAERRDRIFRSLERRNRIVGFLRLGVPGIGLAVAGFLIFQIILTNMTRDYGLSGLRIDSDQVVIDQPRYGGVMASGARYDISAAEARVQINASDLIDLDGAEIVVREPDGYTMVARAQDARLDLVRQNVAIAGRMHTTDTNDVVGELSNSVIDWPARTLTASGPVRFEFKDGAVLRAQGLVYDAQTGQWDFSQVVYTVPGDGGL